MKDGDLEEDKRDPNKSRKVIMITRKLHKQCLFNICHSKVMSQSSAQGKPVSITISEVLY